jgi:hypothetical protein
MAETGHGEPCEMTDVAFDKSIPGVWFIPRDTFRHVRGDLPPVRWPGSSEWVTTPTLARLRELADDDAPFCVERAWTWPRRSRFLRGAADVLKTARVEAWCELDAARNAMRRATTAAEARGPLRRVVTAGAVLEAVKSLYRVETGRFLSEGRDRSSGWARPDWGATVIATARANLHRRLYNLGATPFAIATDGLAFASSEPDAVRFAHSIRLPLGRGLGQFRHEATAPAERVFEVFESTRGVLRTFAAARDGEGGEL